MDSNSSSNASFKRTHNSSTSWLNEAMTSSVVSDALTGVTTTRLIWLAKLKVASVPELSVSDGCTVANNMVRAVPPRASDSKKVSFDSRKDKVASRSRTDSDSATRPTTVCKCDSVSSSGHSATRPQAARSTKASLETRGPSTSRCAPCNDSVHTVCVRAAREHSDVEVRACFMRANCNRSQSSATDRTASRVKDGTYTPYSGCWYTSRPSCVSCSGDTKRSAMVSP
mmetsp:Transcript_44452/g.117534  ORF Transcript_44452/g.117534 Transcript_44452/m.117534 type:complete len:227 (-) Transcript_44452:484-1164(-)